MIRFTQNATCLILLIALFGCAGLENGFETPTVGVRSFRVLPSDGAMPQFEISLHIINPNRTELKLVGLVYSVTLEGHKVITGVSNDLPIIEPYGEGEVMLLASADLLNSIRLIATLLKSQQEKFNYELEAKLDIGKFHPRIHVVDKGDIFLQGQTSKDSW
ncbi:MAG: LEA type 2 family protein [Deltaproteobacteria bacterium]|jgi:LEA14-like dessication related protein|nr:LEA type 2 family protein [Deltaproteobacteria bacterium]MBW2519886.1 LEA type 2 family protein [Deltaproteobacteria bacterium]